MFTMLIIMFYVFAIICLIAFVAPVAFLIGIIKVILFPILILLGIAFDDGGSGKGRGPRR